MIKPIEIKYFDDLFNREGYVLDFSTPKFNDFTRKSIGIALCEKYKISKGRSLNKFIKEGESRKVIKLLDELLEYYRVYNSNELIENKVSYSGASYSSLYKKCREIIDREKENNCLL